MYRSAREMMNCAGAAESAREMQLLLERLLTKTTTAQKAEKGVEFIDLECFQGGRSLHDQLSHITARVEDLLASNADERQFRIELADLHSAMRGCIGHAKRIEEQPVKAAPVRRLPYWLRYGR